MPKSLQQISRENVLQNLQGTPVDALKLLNLPKQIKNYLLFSDIDVNLMIKDYKDTMDYINDNGTSNIIHV